MTKENFIEGKITRAEVVVILYIMCKKPETSFKTTFKDVLEDKKYYKAICWAQENSIIVGYGDGTFKPEKLITTQQLIAMLQLFAKYRGIDTSSDVSHVSYKGYEEMSAYAEKAYAWALGSAIYAPLDYDLHAKDYVSREDAKNMIMIYDKKYGMNKGSINNIDTSESNNNEDKLDKIIKNAKMSAFNNLPYVDPNLVKPNASLDPDVGTDSPGFVKALFASQNVEIGDTIEDMEKCGTKIDDAIDFLNREEYSFAKNVLKPGDIIICNNGGHIVLYIGDGKIVHESYSKKKAVEEEIEILKYMPGIKDVRRVIAN